ncbi:hypothetical protein D3C84_710320 [compost metagenome]
MLVDFPARPMQFVFDPCPFPSSFELQVELGIEHPIETIPGMGRTRPWQGCQIGRQFTRCRIRNFAAVIGVESDPTKIGHHYPCVLMPDDHLPITRNWRNVQGRASREAPPLAHVNFMLAQVFASRRKECMNIDKTAFIKKAIH